MKLWRDEMKQLISIALASLVIFACFHISYAKTYWRTFEVAEIQSDGLILEDFEGGRFLINKGPGGFKVGDSVRYDTVRNVLKKNPWQPATVTNVGNNTIRLEFNSGEKLDVNMRSQYREKFNRGDQVFYKASSGQIKASNLQKLDDE